MYNAQFQPLSVHLEVRADSKQMVLPSHLMLERCAAFCRDIWIIKILFFFLRHLRLSTSKMYISSFARANTLAICALSCRGMIINWLVSRSP